MSEDRLRYADLETVIKKAVDAGLSAQKIIDEITRGMDYLEVRAIAKGAAEHLGITEAEFVRKAGRRG